MKWRTCKWILGDRKLFLIPTSPQMLHSSLSRLIAIFGRYARFRSFRSAWNLSQNSWSFINQFRPTQQKEYIKNFFTFARIQRAWKNEVLWSKREFSSCSQNCSSGPWADAMYVYGCYWCLLDWICDTVKPNELEMTIPEWSHSPLQFLVGPFTGSQEHW